MIEFLTTSGLNHRLEVLFKGAKTTITIVSPYIKIHQRLRSILAQKSNEGIEIVVVCRVGELKEDLSDFAARIIDSPKLHAKCYANEVEAIVGSLNLHEFSQINNEEFGFYLRNEGEGERFFRQVMGEVSRLCNQSQPIQPNVSPKAVPSKLVKGQTYSENELRGLFGFSSADFVSGIRKAPSGEIVLLSNVPGRNPVINGIVHYEGQSTGPGEQKPIYGNKDLLDAFREQSTPIHLFTKYVYQGNYYIKSEPYKKDGRFVFPLMERDAPLAK